MFRRFERDVREFGLAVRGWARNPIAYLRSHTDAEPTGHTRHTDAALGLLTVMHRKLSGEVALLTGTAGWQVRR
jgi:hypothetical protein